VIGYAPVDGLTFGLSAYSGTRPVSGVEQRRTVVGAHAEYVDDIWSIRSEFARETDDVNRRTIDGAYAEAAYRLTRTVQIAGMWTTQRSTMKGVNMAYASSLADHDELAGALNYWFTPNLGVKTSFHYVEGNRFSSPEPQNLRRFVANGTLNNITRVVLVGGALSF
jgi:predicted porin